MRTRAKKMPAQAQDFGTWFFGNMHDLEEGEEAAENAAGEILDGYDYGMENHADDTIVALQDYAAFAPADPHDWGFHIALRQLLKAKGGELAADLVRVEERAAHTG